MNIHDQINFNSDKPSVVVIKNSDNINYMAVGLKKDQLLKEHLTTVPTQLVVVKGAIDFHINGDTKRLNLHDTFSIPVNVEHSVTGITDENIFTLVQEL